MREYQICTNCVMDTSDSKIVFDENGMCDHCHNYYENILPHWQHGKNSATALEKTLYENRYNRNEKHVSLAL